MHSSTVSTLVDLFTLALTHPGRREEDQELQEAKRRVRELEEELGRLKEARSAGSVSEAETLCCDLLSGFVDRWSRWNRSSLQC